MLASPATSPPTALPLPSARRLFSSAGGELRALQLADRLEDTLWAACMVNSRCFSETVRPLPGLAAATAGSVPAVPSSALLKPGPVLSARASRPLFDFAQFMHA